MASIRRLLIALPLALVLPASAKNSPDTRFLRSEPYRKTKQKVDISSIENEHDLAVLRDAIDPIMRFMVGMSFAELPPAVGDLLMTANGRTTLRRPPLRNEHKRYSVASVSDFTVCGDTAISCSAVFSNLLRDDSWRERFLFVKSASGWRFDGHREPTC